MEPGLKIVRVNYPKILPTDKAYPTSDNSPVIDVTEDVIPAKYKSASRREKDLTEVSGSVDFDLTTQ